MPAAASSSRSAAPTARRATPHPKPKLARPHEPEQDDTTPAGAPPEPAHPPTRATSEPTEPELVASLFSTTDALEDLAAAHGLSLRALIAWAERRDIVSLRRSMRDLADDRAELIVSRAGTIAAHKLRTLASDADNDETARKACVDLLRMHRAARTSEPELPEPPDRDPDGTAIDDELLARLEDIARATHAPRENASSGESGHGTDSAGAD